MSNSSLAEPDLEPDKEQATGELEHEEPSSTDQFLVSIEESSPEHPYNWPLSKKLFTVAQLSLLAITGSAGSSILSPAQKAVSQEFGVSEEVTVLNISLYVIAFAVGPLIWAPVCTFIFHMSLLLTDDEQVSELYGRRWSLIPAMLGMGLFSIGAAESRNIQTLLVMRFFTGFFGSAPVSNVSAALGDMFAPKMRGSKWDSCIETNAN
jgi:MFS family permease